MPVYTQKIDYSDSLEEACRRFLGDVRSWAYDCMEIYAETPVSDVHDQGTYMVGWAPYVHVAQDEEALAFMRAQRDRIRDHYAERDLWHHGYWRTQEAHHGTEHFELFLGTLLNLDPDDGETRAQLEDAAEHMGNWTDEVEPWYDFEARRFRSFFFGTDGVADEAGKALNRPDHLRCANICLLAYRATQRQRYLDLATEYVGEWAEAILADEPIPLALTPTGVLYELEDDEESIYRTYLGEAAGLVSPVDRAENFLSSDAINTLLFLWDATAEERFRQACEKLLDVLSTQVGDPDAGAAADAIRTYRSWTGDARYDGPVRAIGNQAAPRIVRELVLDTDLSLDFRPGGIGKRSDMAIWLENGKAPRWHNPITLAVAAEIDQDTRLATRAVDLARAYFALAREAFPDGRDHGCAARTVSAVARGHGRDNNVGMVTGVLGPLCHHFGITLDEDTD